MSKQDVLERREALNHMMMQLAEQGAGNARRSDDGKYVYELDPSKLDLSAEQKSLIGETPKDQAEKITSYFNNAYEAIPEELREKAKVSLDVTEKRLTFTWNPEYTGEIVKALGGDSAKDPSSEDLSRSFSGIVAIMARTEGELAKRGQARKHDAVAKAGEMLGRRGVTNASMDDDGPGAPLPYNAKLRERSAEHSA